MDRLIAETEKEVETKKDEMQKDLSVFVKNEENQNPTKSSPTGYLSSFENLTLADVKKKEEKKQQELFKKEKETLIQGQYKKVEKEVTSQKASQKIIEKPNYDFIEENKKAVSPKKHTEKKSKKKMAGIIMACTLGASAIICVANVVVLENLNSQFLQLEETYKFNLASYLKNIYNLDTTKKSMEMIETYPEDLLDAGDLGQKTNWFDKLCSYLGGLFGG